MLRSEIKESSAKLVSQNIKTSSISIDPKDQEEGGGGKAADHREEESGDWARETKGKRQGLWEVRGNVRMFINKTRSIVNFIMNDDIKILNYAFALRPIRLPSPRLALGTDEEEGKVVGRRNGSISNENFPLGEFDKG